MLFKDFNYWLNYLIDLSKKTNYDWYIKPHPDYLPGTLENIKKIVLDKSDIKMVDPAVSWKQLVEEGGPQLRTRLFQYLFSFFILPVKEVEVLKLC